MTAVALTDRREVLTAAMHLRHVPAPEPAVVDTIAGLTLDEVQVISLTDWETHLATPVVRRRR